MNLRARAALIVVVTALLVACFAAWGIRLGQDLEGGATLRFSVDFEAAEQTRLLEPHRREQTMDHTLAIIGDRLNKYGLAEISVVPIPPDKFEVSLPAQVDRSSIVDIVTALGDLQFRIEVLAREDYESRYRGSWAEDGTKVPRLEQPPYPWNGTPEEFRAFKQAEVERWKYARNESRPYEPHPDHPQLYVVKRSDTEGAEVGDFVVLERDARSLKFTGEMLEDVVPTTDDKGRPVVVFRVKGSHQGEFERWTGANQGLPMAIVLNDEWHSSPTIRQPLRDNVQISMGSKGMSQAKKDAEQLATVLQTGALKVRPVLESEIVVGPRLAGESRQRGILAVILAFVLVLAFMVLYYRGSGVVANVALLLNLVMIVGALAFFQAVLTLPGIAGIVLTLGMAVDANILISERIREERLLGRSMRRAVSEGYDRAFTTIVDANITSLITAVFLYAYGSGPVKGFAITLGIGLVVSMFTAIFVTRTLVEAWMRAGGFREIRMLGSGRPPSFRWVRMRRFLAPISTAGVLFGLVVFAVEDPNTFYDVDFTGGIKLQAGLARPVEPDAVRRSLEGEPRTVTVQSQHFDEEGRRTQVPREVRVGPYLGSEVFAVGARGDAVEIKIQRDLRLEKEALSEEERLDLDEQTQAFEGYVRQVLGDRLRPDWIREGPTPFTAGEDADEALRKVDGGLAATITFYDPAEAVTPGRLEKALERMPHFTHEGGRRRSEPADSVRRTVVVRPMEDEGEAEGEGAAEAAPLRSFRIWVHTSRATSDLAIAPARFQENLGEFLRSPAFRSALQEEGAAPEAAEEVALSEPFPSVDAIGRSVAERLRRDAMIALFLSLVGIIVYIALRFHSRAMGLAAVLCLFHDVAITLGIVAIVNLMGWVDAKISLPMVAAFLTLVGYSVNDTVVVFDRMRENRGKRPTLTAPLIDRSINQTFSRSIKTSVTFFLACMALFVLNIGQRNVLEGFAFLLIVGAVVGTYSTVAIAAPLLLYLPWLWERVLPARPRAEIVTKPASSPFLLVLVPVLVLLWLAWAVLFAAASFVAGIFLFPVWALGTPVAGEEEAHVAVPVGAGA